MAIKNYTSDIPINRIFQRIQDSLAQHGARQISFDYGDTGKVYGVFFTILLDEKKLQVKLPARVDKALAVLQKQYKNGLMRDRKTSAIFRRGNKKEMDEQAYRVAWRNILDWVEAQMALLEIEMARIEEIFLPYMVNSTGETFFERIEQRGFLLEAGEKQ
jgi:hypothetical protein